MWESIGCELGGILLGHMIEELHLPHELLLLSQILLDLQVSPHYHHQLNAEQHAVYNKNHISHLLEVKAAQVMERRQFPDLKILLTIYLLPIYLFIPLLITYILMLILLLLFYSLLLLFSFLLFLSLLILVLRLTTQQLLFLYVVNCRVYLCSHHHGRVEKAHYLDFDSAIPAVFEPNVQMGGHLNSFEPLLVELFVEDCGVKELPQLVKRTLQNPLSLSGGQQVPVSYKSLIRNSIL